MRLKYLKNEAGRLLRQYSAAIRANAGGRLSQLPNSTYEILLARLVYGVGPVNHAIYRLSKVPRSEWADYVTDGPDFKQFLCERNPEAGRRITANKLAFYRHCQQHRLPTVPVLCTLAAADDCSDIAVPNVTTLENWRAVMADAPIELFIKPIDGTHGDGAFAALRDNGRLKFAGHTGTIDDLYEHIRSLRSHDAGWMVQPRFYPHETLAGLVSPHSLATVRIITQLRNGQAEPLGAVLKVTVGNNIIDNFLLGTTGNLVAGIDLSTGCLTNAWGSTRTDWPIIQAFPCHPESGRRFEGTVLPYWPELLELALRGQQSFPAMRTLGWDIAAARDGPTIVEVNSTYDVVLLQLAHQRGFKRFLTEALA